MNFETDPVENDTTASEAHVQLDQKVSAKVNETVTVAYVLRSNKSSIATPQYENVFFSNNEFPQELVEYENVYLVRMEASN